MQNPTNQPKLMKSRIDFVLVQVRDDAETEANVATVCRAAESHGAEFDLFGSLITLTWGTLVDEAPREKRPEKLIAELSSCLGVDVKILHGSEIGHSGFLVGKNQVQYSTILPHFSEARHRLNRLEWGQVIKFQK